MKERKVLEWLSQEIEHAGDDAAVIPFRDTNLILTIDMLWEKTDFPPGTTPYTIGWRTVGVSLSDLAAMGATPLGIVVALGAPSFDAPFLTESLKGSQDCCELVDAPYVGGDLSAHSELTLTSSALGETKSPIMRSGTQVGDLVCVTGELGRTAAALKHFERGNMDEANKLFQFTPRVREGLRLAQFATSMMDISDGLARSLYQLAEASGVGFVIESDQIPVSDSLKALTTRPQELREGALYTGEDFELLFTMPPNHLEELSQEIHIRLLGEVVNADNGISLKETDGLVELENRGYEHG